MVTTLVDPVISTSTTTFTSSDPVPELCVRASLSHDLDIVDSATTGSKDDTLASFMAKPLIITSGSISPSNLAGTLVFQFDILSQLTSNTIWANKVSGHINVRGTAKVRLQINANPFQAGRILLCYLPNHRNYAETSSQHLRNLLTLTQTPHVEMTLQDTSCILEIPYIAPTTHANLQTGFYDWGTVFCYIYSPLATGGSSPNTAFYTAWLSFDDFELDTPVVPHAFVVKGQRGVIRKYRSKYIKSNLDSEVNEGNGPISSVLSGVSSIAATVSQIPILSPIAGPISWFTNLASGVASAFGWSKPILDTTVSRISHNPHPYLAVTNETDVSNQLGLIADNKVRVMDDVNLSGIDEMSIAFLKRQKAYFFDATWNSSDLPGVLFKTLVKPNNFQTAYTNQPFGATSLLYTRTFTPVAFLANIYKYWRGSLEFTFKIVKTQYHTGRLMVAFDPNCTNNNTASITDTNYLHREVIDLRDGDTFVVKIPFCYNSLYDLNEDTVSISKYNPILYVFILNELRAPETCSQSVDFIVEVRGGDDLEFQCPTPINLTPVSRVVPQGASDGHVEPVVESDIGGSVIHNYSQNAAQLCIGESSTSLLQLCKRYCRFSMATWNSSYFNFNINPYVLGGFYTTGVINGGSVGPIQGDYISLFSSFFAHSRGGTRYRLIRDPYTASNTNTSIFTTLFNASPGSTPLLNFNNTQYSLGYGVINPYTGAGTTYAANFDSAAEAGATAALPMYSRTFARLNNVDYAPGTYLNRPDVPAFGLAMTSGNSFGTNTSLFRCGADDYHLSFFCGIPPLGYVST